MLKHLQDPWVKATPADAPLGTPVESAFIKVQPLKMHSEK
jgi:hypothetical protein